MNPRAKFVRRKRKVNDTTMVIMGVKSFCLIPAPLNGSLVSYQRKFLAQSGQDNSALGELAGMPPIQFFENGDYED